MGKEFKKIVTRTISQGQLWITNLNCSTLRHSVSAQQDWCCHLHNTHPSCHSTQRSQLSSCHAAPGHQHSSEVTAIHRDTVSTHREQDHTSTQQELGPEGAAESEHSLQSVWELQGCSTQNREDIPSHHLTGGCLTPAQTRGTQQFGKGMGSLTNTNGSQQGCEHRKLLQHKTRHNYICQPQRSPQTQLGRSIKWDLFKNEKAGNKLHPFSLENNAGINSFSGKQKEVTWSRFIGT